MTEQTPGLSDIVQAPADASVFDSWDPANISPLVAYLATENCPATGKVYFVQGGQIRLFQPWTMTDTLDKDDRWTVAELPGGDAPARGLSDVPGRRARPVPADEAFDADEVREAEALLSGHRGRCRGRHRRSPGRSCSATGSTAGWPARTATSGGCCGPCWPGCCRSTSPSPSSWWPCPRWPTSSTPPSRPSPGPPPGRCWPSGWPRRSSASSATCAATERLYLVGPVRRGGQRGAHRLGPDRRGAHRRPPVRRRPGCGHRGRVDGPGPPGLLPRGPGQGHGLVGAGRRGRSGARGDHRRPDHPVLRVAGPVLGRAAR